MPAQFCFSGRFSPKRIPEDDSLTFHIVLKFGVKIDLHNQASDVIRKSQKKTFFYFSASLEFTCSKPGTEPVTTKSKSDSPGVFQVSLNVVEEKFWGHFLALFSTTTERNGESSNSCDASATTGRRRRRRWFFSGGGGGRVKKKKIMKLCNKRGEKWKGSSSSEAGNAVITFS